MPVRRQFLDKLSIYVEVPAKVVSAAQITMNRAVDTTKLSIRKMRKLWNSKNSSNKWNLDSRRVMLSLSKILLKAKGSLWELFPKGQPNRKMKFKSSRNRISPWMKSTRTCTWSFISWEICSWTKRKRISRKSTRILMDLQISTKIRWRIWIKSAKFFDIYYN